MRTETHSTEQEHGYPAEFQEWVRAWHRNCGWTAGPPDGLYSADSLYAAWRAGQLECERLRRSMHAAAGVCRNAVAMDSLGPIGALAIALEGDASVE